MGTQVDTVRWSTNPLKEATFRSEQRQCVWNGRFLSIEDENEDDVSFFLLDISLAHTLLSHVGPLTGDHVEELGAQIFT